MKNAANPLFAIHLGQQHGYNTQMNPVVTPTGPHFDPHLGWVAQPNAGYHPTQYALPAVQGAAQLLMPHTAQYPPKQSYANAVKNGKGPKPAQQHTTSVPVIPHSPQAMPFGYHPNPSQLYQAAAVQAHAQFPIVVPSVAPQVVVPVAYAPVVQAPVMALPQQMAVPHAMAVPYPVAVPQQMAFHPPMTVHSAMAVSQPMTTAYHPAPMPAPISTMPATYGQYGQYGHPASIQAPSMTHPNMAQPTATHVDLTTHHAAQELEAKRALDREFPPLTAYHSNANNIHAPAMTMAQPVQAH